MKSDLDVKVTAGIAVALFIILALFKGPEFSKNIISISSNAIAGTAFLRFLFIRWMWKWPVIRLLEKVHGVPYLEGHWVGKYKSTGNEKVPTDRYEGSAVIEIVQPSIHSIKITRRSEESESRSFGENIQMTESGAIDLSYSYLSEPKAIVRERSQISYGSAKLSFRRKPLDKLEGNYWTDQKITGTLELTKN